MKYFIPLFCFEWSWLTAGRSAAPLRFQGLKSQQNHIQTLFTNGRSLTRPISISENEKGGGGAASRSELQCLKVCPTLHENDLGCSTENLKLR